MMKIEIMLNLRSLEKILQRSQWEPYRALPRFISDTPNVGAERDDALLVEVFDSELAGKDDQQGTVCIIDFRFLERFIEFFCQHWSLDSLAALVASVSIVRRRYSK